MFQSKAKTMFRRVANTYNKNQLVCNTISTMALVGAGDMIAQCIEAKMRLSALAESASGGATSMRVSIPSSAKHQLFASAVSQEAQLGVPKCLASLLPTTSMSLYANRGHITKETAAKIAAKPANKEPSVFDEIDLKRSARVSLIGLLMGPFGHFWFKALEAVLPARTLTCILMKVGLDQIISAPLLNVFYIFGSHGLEGMPLWDICSVFKEKFPTIYAYDCSMWPIAQLINFSFVPPALRLLYVNALSLVWNSILSYILFEKVTDMEGMMMVE